MSGTGGGEWHVAFLPSACDDSASPSILCQSPTRACCQPSPPSARLTWPPPAVLTDTLPSDTLNKSKQTTINYSQKARLSSLFICLSQDAGNNSDHRHHWRCGWCLFVRKTHRLPAMVRREAIDYLFTNHEEILNPIHNNNSACYTNYKPSPSTNSFNFYRIISASSLQ